MPLEKLTFKFKLYSIMWDEPPCIKIMLDDKMYFDDVILSNQNNPKII